MLIIAELDGYNSSFRIISIISIINIKYYDYYE